MNAPVVEPGTRATVPPGTTGRRGAAGRAGGATRSSTRLRGYLLGTAFLLPSLIIFGLFIYWPMWRTISLSMHGNDVIGQPSVFVGLEHFAEVLTQPEFRHVLLVTGLFTVLTVIPSTLIGLAIAVSLQGKFRGVGIFRTLFATPFAFSAATASVVFAVCFNPATGIFNSILEMFGRAPVPWLTSNNWALPSVAIVTVWMQLGYNLLVLSAGLQSISEDIYEAAKLDGSTGLSTLIRITLPLLSPSIFLVIVISTISSLQTFGQIHILTEGGPGEATRTLVYSIYSDAFAFASSNFGLASAQAVILLLVVALITGVQFRVIGRRVFYQ